MHQLKPYTNGLAEYFPSLHASRLRTGLFDKYSSYRYITQYQKVGDKLEKSCIKVKFNRKSSFRLLDRNEEQQEKPLRKDRFFFHDFKNFWMVFEQNRVQIPLFERTERKILSRATNFYKNERNSAIVVSTRVDLLIALDVIFLTNGFSQSATRFHKKYPFQIRHS